MAVMTMDVSSLPWLRRLTAEEFFELETPDDGRRYELIDGVLVVSPSPFVPHQDLQAELLRCLFAAQPARVKVLAAPLDVRLSGETVIQPDILVVRAEDARDKRLTGVPLLAVELLSDSTRAMDLLLKRERCERAGVPSYWVVEPGTGDIVVWELDPDGGYAEVATARLRDAPLRLERPFPVTLHVPR